MSSSLISTFTTTLPLSVSTSFSESSTTYSTLSLEKTESTTKLLLPTQDTSTSQISSVAKTVNNSDTTENPITAKEDAQKQQVADVIYDYDEDNENEQEVNNDDKVSTQTATKRSDRKRRADETKEIWGKLIPGACIKGCAIGFYAFSIVSALINCFGASGRIGNLLVNYRCVSHQDKSVTQGLILMLISLFALIPGPILFGRIIDSTCLVWTEQCSGRKGVS